MLRAGTFIGLVLLFPCPWYLIAVGGLLPLPVIVLYGAAGGIILAFSLVHLVVYAGVFYLIARWVDARVRAGRVRADVAGALVAVTLLALSVVPIYGGGENLAAGNKLKYNAYGMYREAWREVTGGYTIIPP